jgi:hypothetical protein
LQKNSYKKETEMNKWYESKIVGLAILAVLEGVNDGIVNGWSWRQYAIAGIGVAIIVARAFFTGATASAK